MKKIMSVAAAAMMVSAETFAGGLLTNTNQNASFLRQMSQDAIIDITGLYMNPAGTAFLNNGWHLSLNVQNAKQERNIKTTFPYFVLNTATPGQATHKFKGEALAPVIPSFQLSYNHDKWSVNANFAIGGGGGKCEFDNGLGSFEALYAGQIFSNKDNILALVNQGFNQNLPGLLTQGFIDAGYPEATAQAAAAMLAPTATMNSDLTGYSLNAYMKGRNYVFGLTLGGTYKFTDNLAGYVGVRLQYATNNYNGYVQDVKAHYAIQYDVPANAAASFPGKNGSVSDAAPLGSDLSLNCDQTAFGVAPVIGIDWRANEHWNFAAKYEAPTKLTLKNETEMNDYAKAQVEGGNATLGQFADGNKVREDIPGLLTLGAQYSPCGKLRLMAGFHEYFDKSAKRYNDKQKLIDKNTWELTAGAEYDICKWLTVSASWQRTKYGVSDAFMNDLSFNVSSNALGCGVRINASDRCHIDLAYMYNFYQDRTVQDPNPAWQGTKFDTYNRTNRVLGLGVNLDF